MRENLFRWINSTKIKQIVNFELDLILVLYFLTTHYALLTLESDFKIQCPNCSF